MNQDTPMYEIRVRGQLDERRAWQFEGLILTLLPDGDTLLRGQLADQSALYGVLSRIRDMGLLLLGVQRLKPAETDADGCVAPPGSGPSGWPET